MSFSAWDIVPVDLLQGAGVTIILTMTSIVLGQLLGLALALLRYSPTPVLDQALAIAISVLRATPLLTLVLVVFFVTPALGYDISAPAAAVLAMTLNTSAFNSEIWRGGLSTVPKEQSDAAKASGMHSVLLLRRIVLPQVARHIRPMLINEMTILIKNSPAVAVIGIVELTRAAVRMGANSYKPLPPLIASLMLYAAIVWILLALQRYFERKDAEASR